MRNHGQFDCRKKSVLNQDQRSQKRAAGMQNEKITHFAKTIGADKCGY